MMNEITNYMFRLSVERGGETVLNTVIAAGGDDVQKAKRTVQKLLNDFTPGGGKPARARCAGSGGDGGTGAGGPGDG